MAAPLLFGVCDDVIETEYTAEGFGVKPKS
jgi:hypothetical protein